MTDFISKQVFFARIKVIPRVEYTFQVIAREDKGSMLGIAVGIDYNKSKLSTFKTSRLNINNQPFSNLPRPLNSNDPKLDYGNIRGANSSGVFPFIMINLMYRILFSRQALCLSKIAGITNLAIY